MNPGDFQARAGAMKAGAVFHRCALQVNPHHYRGTFRGRQAGGDARAHAAAIVVRAKEMGVSVLAVTDHNDVSGVRAFQDAAEGLGITVFPGFELSSSEGIHVLCIYSPGASEEKLGRFLGDFGILETKPSSQLSSHSFIEILAKVRKQDGIPIAAHVTNANGLLEVLEGQARIQAWRSDDLLAVQIPGGIADLPQDVRPIVENRSPDYRRGRPAGENLAVAVVNAGDISEPADLEQASATCWIKMSEVSVEGLRQAFLDPGSRIRLNDREGDSEPEEHGELVALGWEGGSWMA